ARTGDGTIAGGKQDAFSRSFQLPIEVDPDAVKAAYKNGVLTVTLPKPPEAESGARTIPVASS
ncbi:MAG: Hsp20 family protein, partial [Myxococcota bacterium]